MIYAAPSPVLHAMPNDAADAPGKNPPAPNFSGRRGLTDLLPRVLSAIVLMAAALVSVWRGGVVFDLIWAGAALAVGCEWQNLIAAPNRRLRFFLVALGLVVGAYFAGKAWFGAACSLLGLWRARPRSGRGPRAEDLGIWRDRLRGFAARFHRRAAWLGGVWGKIDRVAFRDRVGHRCFRLFRRPPDRRRQTLAENFALENLVGHVYRRFGRGFSRRGDRRSWPWRSGAGPPIRARPCHGRRLARRRHLQILGQTALRRKKFERLDSGSWRVHGSARWIYRRRRFRRHCRRRAGGCFDRRWTVRLVLGRPASASGCQMRYCLTRRPSLVS